MAKTGYPGIPEPKADLKSLLATVQALRIAVEILTRSRGTETQWPLLVGEARQLGAIGVGARLPLAPDTKGRE